MSKYEPCANTSWIGAVFVIEQEDRYGYPTNHKAPARCNACNKFFNWKKLKGLTSYPQKSDLHCPHCDNVVYKTNFQ